MRDIELVPTSELITELLSRYEHAVFAGLSQVADDQHIRRKWTGNSLTCQGLCAALNRSIDDHRENESLPLSSEDSV